MKTKHIFISAATPLIILFIVFTFLMKAERALAGDQPDHLTSANLGDGSTGEASLTNLQVSTLQFGPEAVISVTTTDPAVNPGDTFCSLIEAINNANSDSDTSAGDCPAGSGADEIVLGAAENYILTTAHNSTDGDNGLPVITSTITVSGQGSTIERDPAAPAFRILYVASGGELTLNNITISNGMSSDGLNGGGIRNQGGILTLNNSTVLNSEAVNANGGGIYSRAEGANVATTIIDSDILSNTAGISGGGLYVIAGSNVTATLTVTNSQVNFNHAGESAGGIRSTRLSNSTNYSVQVNVLGSKVIGNTTLNSLGFVGGGGMVINYAEMLLADSIVSDNRAETGSAYGGGLINTFSDIIILRSTIKDNVAASVGGPYPAGGGGVVNSDGEMLIVNSTIAGNEATGNASGGALLAVNFFGSTPSIVTVFNSTISDNNTDASAGAVSTMDFAGGQPVVVDFVNTIVANNPAPDSRNCVAAPSTTIMSTGFNLEDLDTCNFNQAGDFINTDPILGPLQNNGGQTPTYALLFASPAIDAADDVTCMAAPVDGMDQRGLSRPQGSGCDIGAYEVSAITGLTATNDSPTSLGELTTFTATVTAGEMVSYTWEFGDGTFDSGATANHIYAKTGTFTAIVTATNPVNSVSTTTLVTVVEPDWSLYLPLVLKQP